MPRIVKISKDSSDLDISTQDIVVYGAGADCLRLLRTVEHSHAFDLSAIACIIDRNPKKQGTEFEYGRKRFPVCPPDILRSLDPNNSIVIISSRKYADRMLETIQQTIPSSAMPVVADPFCFLRPRYETIEELLASDPIVQDGLLHSGWGKSRTVLLHLFRSAFEHAHGNRDVDFFSPIPGGMNSLLFGYEVEGEPFVFRAQRTNLSIGGEYFKGDPSLAIELRNIADKAGIGKELLVYQDNEYCRIERHANTLTCADIESKDFVSEVLGLLRRLHAIETPYPFRGSLLDAWCRTHISGLTRLFPHYLQQLLTLQSLFRPIFSEYQKLSFKACICHGEPHTSNIVHYKGRFVLIDWDTITVDDPLFDVCTLLFSMKIREWSPAETPYSEFQRSVYDSLDETLRLYYGRPCTELEYRRAELVTRGIEILKLMERLAVEHQLDIDRYDALVASCANLKLH